MDKNPKRRKFKENPYTLEKKEKDNLYYIIFNDFNGFHKVKVTKKIYDIFDESERYENARLKEYSIHIEHSEQSEINLNLKNTRKEISLEDEVLYRFLKQDLKSAINELPEIQKRRIKKYYFENKTFEMIAKEEHCTKRAIKFSVDTAIEKLSKKLKN